MEDSLPNIKLNLQCPCSQVDYSSRKEQLRAYTKPPLQKKAYTSALSAYTNNKEVALQLATGIAPSVRLPFRAGEHLAEFQSRAHTPCTNCVSNSQAEECCESHHHGSGPRNRILLVISVNMTVVNIFMIAPAGEHPRAQDGGAVAGGVAALHPRQRGQLYGGQCPVRTPVVPNPNMALSNDVQQRALTGAQWIVRASAVRSGAGDTAGA